jgi:hypothetical protein
MTSINFVSTTRIATSTIQSFEVKLWDTTSNLYNPITLSNNFLLVNGQPLQGGGNFASTMSTYQTYTSTLFIGDESKYSFTSLYPLDVDGVGRMIELSTLAITTSSLQATNQLSTFEAIASTIQTNELNFVDIASNTPYQVVLSNQTFLIDGKPLQTGGFASSLSTYQIFASTLQLSDPSLFNFTAEFNLDITGTARITNYISVGTVYTGAQHVGLQFG